MGAFRWDDLGRVFKAHPDLRACIIGTGRHGSGWVAKTLSQNGIPCGHEQVFGWSAGESVMAESSWLAAPYAKRLRHQGVMIYHQVRHPEHTLKSMLGGEMFGPGRKNRWFQFRMSHLPMTGDDMIDAMRIYVQWNLMCEEPAYRWWRIEDFEARHFWQICSDISHRGTWRQRAPIGVNAHKKLSGFTLDDLPRGREYDDLMMMGERYGYF